jgi:hypothetical protein
MLIVALWVCKPLFRESLAACMHSRCSLKFRATKPSCYFLAAVEAMLVSVQELLISLRTHAISTSASAIGSSEHEALSQDKQDEEKKKTQEKNRASGSPAPAGGGAPLAIAKQVLSVTDKLDLILLLGPRRSVFFTWNCRWPRRDRLPSVCVSVCFCVMMFLGECLTQTFPEHAWLQWLGTL